MLVSIILTCYNHKNFIWEAIESVINQTFSNRELLIWDDSPNGKTWEVIEWYVKKYPEKIHARHYEENRWITRNMEFLISKSKWDYIAVLEWDDYRDKNYLKEKINIFRNGECYLVFNDLIEVDSNSKVITHNYLKSKWKTKFYKYEILNLDKILTSWEVLYHSWSTLMFRSSILNNFSIKIPWMSPYNLISDYNLFLRLCSKYPVFWTEKELTYYRVHNQNTSKLNTYDLVLDCYKLFIFYKEQKLITNITFQKIATHYLLLIIVGHIRMLLIISKKYTAYNIFYLFKEKIKNKIYF